MYLRKFFVQQMIKHLPLPAQQLGCLVPVPMHKDKLKVRGFNHAAVLAKALAKPLGIPYDLFSRKISNTPAQAQLSYTQRRSNLGNAFAMKAHPYPTITLIDDLLTTGSTAEALAALLKKDNQTQVFVWTLARTSMDRSIRCI